MHMRVKWYKRMAGLMANWTIRRTSKHPSVRINNSQVQCAYFR